MEAVWKRDVSGHAMFRVCQKLRALKPILRRLNKDNYADISNRVIKAKKELEDVQQQLLNNPKETLYVQERSLMDSYWKIRQAEEEKAEV